MPLNIVLTTDEQGLTQSERLIRRLYIVVKGEVI